jgi:predicted membrane channel-forming protein YqfA (hemolysin III family)
MCTEVSPQCPVKATTMGYYPNKGVNIFIAVCFAIAAVVTLAIGIRKRTWSFMIFIAAGCILELAGSLLFFWRIPLRDGDDDLEL